MLYDVETKENVCTALLINQLLLGNILNYDDKISINIGCHSSIEDMTCLNLIYL